MNRLAAHYKQLPVEERILHLDSNSLPRAQAAYGSLYGDELLGRDDVIEPVLRSQAKWHTRLDEGEPLRNLRSYAVSALAAVRSERAAEAAVRFIREDIAVRAHLLMLLDTWFWRGRHCEPVHAFLRVCIKDPRSEVAWHAVVPLASFAVKDDETLIETARHALTGTQPPRSIYETPEQVFRTAAHILTTGRRAPDFPVDPCPARKKD
jgi:hypothetical protein